jgi:hypothetical protein
MNSRWDMAGMGTKEKRVWSMEGINTSYKLVPASLLLANTSFISPRLHLQGMRLFRMLTYVHI